MLGTWLTTADEIAGMAWWNNLTEAQRAEVLRTTPNWTVAEAWARHKRGGTVDGNDAPTACDARP